MKQHFDFKGTLNRNFREIIRLSFSLILFFMGLHGITKSTDQTAIVFLTLGWIYVFFKDFFRKFDIELIFKNEKGEDY